MTHSSRLCPTHSYVTWLVDNDVSPKLAQRLARHASITLTMDRYYKPSIANERAALKKLPSVTKKPTDGDAEAGAR